MNPRVEQDTAHELARREKTKGEKEMESQTVIESRIKVNLGGCIGIEAAQALTESLKKDIEASVRRHLPYNDSEIDITLVDWDVPRIPIAGDGGA